MSLTYIQLDLTYFQNLQVKRPADLSEPGLNALLSQYLHIIINVKRYINDSESYSCILISKLTLYI